MVSRLHPAASVSLLVLLALIPPVFLSLNGLSTTWLSTSWAEEPSTPPPSKTESAATPDSGLSSVQNLVGDYCLDCHNADEQKAGVNLERAVGESALEPELWEAVVKKLRTRQMPPADMPRPDEATYGRVVGSLEQVLDAQARQNPHAGRTESFRRLTRIEYRNAIRDLLALNVDVETLLPKDESSGGFDNITVGELSPTLLNRYVRAAQKISRLAVGSSQDVAAETFRIRADLTQERHLPGLPIGTRGGASIRYHFPQGGEYEVRVRLARDRNEHVEGLRGKHDLEILLDDERKALLKIEPPRGSPDHSRVDAHLAARITVEAGPHDVAVTFPRQSRSLLETMRQPYQSRFNMHRHPRTGPAVFQVSITGPYEATGPGDTPSRQRIFISYPATPEQESEAGRRIVASLAHRAWRRPVSEQDLEIPLAFFEQARAGSGFEAGVEAALAAILVNPRFLFRIETQPAEIATGDVYRISDLELASRLSFFLWSSIPDEELLELAAQGQLRDSAILERQVRRMLKDQRSLALVTNFAGQWLHLRNLDSVHPDMRLFPDFDHNLRQAMRRETELMFQQIVQDDRSILELLRSDETYLNERLARHYGISHVLGSRFRRVTLPDDSHRGGLLRHGSLLTVTSYATRTSPVLRGHWILENLLGAPPPPPPADVPDLKDNTVAANLSVRQRLEQHRADPNCAACHRLMDPVGFALENFDAIGRWREREAGLPVDASGGLPDGSQFTGVDGLENGLLARPDLFATTLTEKLLTYALGRGVDYGDAPAVRQAVRQAAQNDYRFSELVLGIVRSTPFQMRTAE